jgi:hypothetical protein
VSGGLHTGSCLCGAVTYEVTGLLSDIEYCQCGMCRKAHGSAFGAYTMVAAEDFRFTRGADKVGHYRSSPQITRSFCTGCGAPLQFIRDGAERFSLTAGTLDGDPDLTVIAQIYVPSKAPWHRLDPDIPAHDGEAE